MFAKKYVYSQCYPALQGFENCGMAGKFSFCDLWILKDIWIYKICRIATQASFPAKYLTGIPEKRWLVLFLFFFSYHFSSKVLLRVWIIYSLVLLLLSVWYWRYELFCIQLKSFYQLAGHDIISHFLYLMTSVTRILTTFQIMSSTILGDKSCENVYEEGITYFGEQVSLLYSTLFLAISRL